MKVRVMVDITTIIIYNIGTRIPISSSSSLHLLSAQNPVAVESGGILCKLT